MKKRNRILIGILLTLAFAICFFALGSYLAAQSGAAEGQGLAGGAIVLGYGAIASLGGVILAIILTIRLAPRWLIALCVVTGIVAAILFIRIFGVALESRAESNAHLQQAYDNLLKFRVSLVNTGSLEDLPFDRMDVDWAKRNYVLSTKGQQCTVEMSGPQAVAMLSALRAVDGVLFKTPFPCAGTSGYVIQQLELFIPEALPPNTEAKLAINAACLEQYPQLSAPQRAAQEILRENGIPKTCNL